MSQYSARTQELARRMDVGDPEPDGWTYLTLDGTRVGRVRRDASGWAWGWWHDEGGWQATRNYLDGGRPSEVAEIWAAHEVASMIDMGERARAEGR